MDKTPGDHELDDIAFDLFASAYPHEAYDAWPDRFLDYAEKKSGLPRETILRLLEKTQ